MKVMVMVKRVIDPYVKIRVKADNSGVETLNIKTVMNPFDEIALEEALRLFEQNKVSEVIALSIDSSPDVLRHALALGASRAILVQTNEKFSSLNVAKILRHCVLQEQIQLVLMGKQSIDGDNNQTPQMLAGLLSWPQATFAARIVLNPDNVIVSREVDNGTQILKLTLPAVISVDLRLNEPRYASLPNIMKAKTKPLQVIPFESLNLNLVETNEILTVSPPKKRTSGTTLNNVAELIDKLKNELM